MTTTDIYSVLIITDMFSKHFINAHATHSFWFIENKKCIILSHKY